MLQVVGGTALVPLRETIRRPCRMVSSSADGRHWLWLTALPFDDHWRSFALAASSSGPESFARKLERNECRGAAAGGGGCSTGWLLNGPEGAVSVLLDSRKPDERQGAKVATLADRWLLPAALAMAAEGPLAGYPLDGTVFRLDACRLDLGPANPTGFAQSTEADPDGLSALCYRALQGSFLGASPAFSEPVYAAELVCSGDDIVVETYAVLSRRGGTLTAQRRHPHVPGLHFLEADVPIARSLGLAADLHATTNGEAIVYCRPTAAPRWRNVPGDLGTPGTFAVQHYLRPARATKAGWSWPCASVGLEGLPPTAQFQDSWLQPEAQDDPEPER
jgi:translation elongation factor EF-G